MIRSPSRQGNNRKFSPVIQTVVAALHGILVLAEKIFTAYIACVVDARAVICKQTRQPVNKPRFHCIFFPLRMSMCVSVMNIIVWTLRRID